MDQGDNVTPPRISLPPHEAKELYQKGMSLSQIAKRFGISKSTVSRRLAEADVEIRMRGGNVIESSFVLPPGTAERYEDGTSLCELERQLSVSRYLITKRLIEAGVKLRVTRKEVTGTELAAVRELAVKRYESGYSIRDIAKETGCSYGFIHPLLKKAGVRLRVSGGSTRSNKPH